MVSQSAVRIVTEHPGAQPTRIAATLELACGCMVEVEVDHNRIFTADDGVRLAVGKYPCPLNHPVSRPR